MKKGFAKHPEREALIRRQYDYYMPRWAAERSKEDTFKQIPEVDKQCIFQCILLMNITEEEIKALCEKAAYRQVEMLSFLNKSIHKHTKLNGLSTLHKAPLPLKNGAVFLPVLWSL